MSVVLSKEFHKDLDLDGSLKAKGWDFLRKLTTDPDLTGLDVKQPRGAVDKRVRTARVDDNYRAVLFEVSDGKANTFFVLAGIKPHDEAYKLAASLELRINPVNGIVEVLRHEDVQQVTRRDHKRPAFQPTEYRPKLLPFTVAELAGLGILEEAAQRAVEITDENELQDLCLALPEWQGDALLQLACGVSLDEVRELYGPETAGEQADTNDLDRALRHPASRMQFVVVTDKDDTELRAMLEGDFRAWRTFLHPEQRSVAYRERWNGSFRLSGGAGTGKTVVAIHRAAFLARSRRARVLLTTFTKTLAAQLEADLVQLAGPGVVSHGTGPVEPGTVRVAGLDSIARSIVARVDGHMPKVIAAQEEDLLWEEVIRDLPGLTPQERELLTPSFLGVEYRNVILGQEITDRQAYFKAPRRGRGVRLNWLQRARVWEAVEAFTRRLRVEGCTTFTALVARAAQILADDTLRGQVDMFDHVIVDEGQDLHATHWLMLRRLVAKGPDDLFICEDSHQRIYGERLVLSRFGIDVRGRSRKLTLNYRTTRENLRFALGILQGERVVDLEGGDESTRGYRSRLSGPVPELHGSETPEREQGFIVGRLYQWLVEAPDGKRPEPDSLGVLVRTNRRRDELARALRQAGIATEVLTGDSEPTGKGVRVATMHRAKGMEFARVIVAGVSDGTLPSKWLLDNTPPEDRAEIEQRERLLLYVACTRARDQLVVTWSGAPSPYLPKPMPTT